MIKRITAIVILLATYHLAKAQLTIYPNIQQTGTGQVCAASGLYIGANIPGGLNNRIRSIKLDNNTVLQLFNGASNVVLYRIFQLFYILLCLK